MQRLSLSYTQASKLGLCPSVGSAHILFKCQRIPLFVPTMLNTNSLQLYHIYSEVKLPCTSLQRHPLRRILRPVGVHSQTWDRRADPALRTCWRTKQQQQGWHQAASSTAGHTATSSSTAQTANHPRDTQEFFLLLFTTTTCRISITATAAKLPGTTYLTIWQANSPEFSHWDLFLES